MKRLVVCALLAAGCGLPLPTDGSTACGRRVYLEAGLTLLDCPAALSYTRNAETVVGVDLSGLTVEYFGGDTLAQLGEPTAWGRWTPGNIAVSAHVAVSVIHEALHERYGGNHCHWATRFVPLLEANAVPGAFDDDCEHVHCASTNFWQDGTGQGFGNRYVCTPL